MKIEPSSIRKMNIKGKIILNTTSGIREIPLAEAKQYARSNCKVCEDFSSELADISVGGLGLENWTFVIIRTERGEELFNKALEAGVLKTRPVEKSEFALSLLVKLSAKKRKPSSQ
jgi:coenzyme F420 hydrogenase subunit beta